MGESDKPRIRYSTSEMAKDTLEVIDHVGWTKERQLHIIGISMGGMIAQELVRFCKRRTPLKLTLLAGHVGTTEDCFLESNLHCALHFQHNGTSNGAFKVWNGTY